MNSSRQHSPSRGGGSSQHLFRNLPEKSSLRKKKTQVFKIGNSSELLEIKESSPKEDEKNKEEVKMSSRLKEDLV
jgi:hypothetical protein